MPSSTHSNGYRERNSTSDRTLTILGMFSEAKQTVTASEVADELGVARSTAYRYVQSLVSERFLEESPWGGFRLGVRLLELARLAKRSYGLAEVAVPVMTDLATRFHQTVLLTRRVGASVVCIERRESDEQRIRLSYERGSMLPTNAGASAHVLLAWLPEGEIRSILNGHAFTRFTDTTITSIDALIEQYGRIKEAGYAISHGEVDKDVVGVAVPIFDERGRVSAGLSIIAVESLLPTGALPELVAALRQSAESIAAVANLSE